MTEENGMQQKLKKMLDELFERIEDRLNPKQKYFTISEVCKLLSVTRRTLQNYRDDKVIKYSQFGKKIWFKSTDVERFINSKLIK